MGRAKLAHQKSPNAFRSIGEVGTELGLQTHVLRYWEGKFPKQIKPVKRKDGRRMFRPVDMDAIKAIQILVHQRGMTLKGARLLLEEQSVEAVLSGTATVFAQTEIGGFNSPAKALQQKLETAFEDMPIKSSDESRKKLEFALSEMTDLKARLDALRGRRAA